MKRWLGSGLILVTGLSAAFPALADPQDFQLSKIGKPTASGGAENANFRAFANQLGAAISSADFSPPETLGHSGFNFALGYSVAKIADLQTQVWPTAGTPPSQALLMPTVIMRKGLPFSFELGGRFAYLTYSRMVAATIEVKWALNEGFLYLPDVGVRGHGTRLVGTRDFGLTTAGVDIGIGKQFAVGGMFTLTPYVGWDRLFVSCYSGVIDFSDSKTTVEQAQSDPSKYNATFETVAMGQNQSNRFYAGLRLITSVLELGAEVSVAQINSNKQVLVASGKLGLDF
jgi:hypothetical protein